MKHTTLPLMVILTAGLATACGNGNGTRGVSPTGSTESGGIVVESTELKTNSDCGAFGPCFDSCDIRGTVRNDTTTDRRVTLTFTVFDRNGNAICFFGFCTTTVGNANGGELIVPAGGRSRYGGRVLAFDKCDKVARLEITELTSTPVA